MPWSARWTVWRRCRGILQKTYVVRIWDAIGHYILALYFFPAKGGTCVALQRTFCQLPGVVTGAFFHRPLIPPVLICNNNAPDRVEAAKLLYANAPTAAATMNDVTEIAEPGTRSPRRCPYHLRSKVLVVVLLTATMGGVTTHVPRRAAPAASAAQVRRTCKNVARKWLTSGGGSRARGDCQGVPSAPVR
jgi:hypothetical protein